MSDTKAAMASPYWEMRTRRRWRRRSSLTLKRAALMGTGCTLMVAGIASVPTPIPIGFVLFAMGLYFLARASKTARRGIKWTRRQVPPLSRGLNIIKPRLPPPMKRFIERSDPEI